MDTKAHLMKQKHKFDKAPLEMNAKDYGIFPGHVLLNLGKDLNDIEACAQRGQLSKLEP